MRSPVRPPPCARSGLPPPRPPKRSMRTRTAAFASSATSGERAMTTVIGGEVENNATAALVRAVISVPRSSSSRGHPSPPALRRQQARRDARLRERGERLLELLDRPAEVLRLGLHPFDRARQIVRKYGQRTHAAGHGVAQRSGTREARGRRTRT